MLTNSLAAEKIRQNNVQQQRRKIVGYIQNNLKIPTILIIGIFIIAVLMRLYTLHAPFDRDSYDEGVYWQSLRAMQTGAPLYQQVFYSQPPFFLLAVFPIYMLFGHTIWAARLTIVIFSLCGFLGAYLLGKAVAGRWGAVIALLLLLADPLYLSESQILQADGPSTALSLLAVALAYLWWQSPEGLSGICLAVLTTVVLVLSICCKLLAVSALAPIGLLALAHIYRIFQRPASARLSSARSLLAGCIAFLLTTLLILAPFSSSLHQLWHLVVTFHTDAKAHLSYTQSANMNTLRQFFLSSPLILLPIVGTIIGLSQRNYLTWIALAWFLATLLMLWQQVPLFPHHLVALVPPLLSLSLLAIIPPKSPEKYASIFIRGKICLFLLLALIVIFVNIHTLRGFYRGIQTASASPTIQQNMLVAQDVRELTTPKQLVITDAQFLVGLADRTTPSALVDTSMVRIETGYLTSEQLIKEASQPQVHAILFYTNRLLMLPDFHTWVSQHFRLVHNYGQGRELWVIIDGARH